MVTDVVEDPEVEPKYKLRAFFSADPAFQAIQEVRDGGFINLPFVSGLKLAGSALPSSDDGYMPDHPSSCWYRRLDFFVPNRVTFLKYYLYQPYSSIYPVLAWGAVKIGSAYVTSGQQIKMILGTEEDTALVHLGSRIRIGDYSEDVGTGGDQIDHSPLTTHTNYFRSSYINTLVYPDGDDSPYSGPAKYITPGYGFAVLEWFEV